ncbi:MAG: apolipoprotein N-acyltransferase [Chromatiales bacterium]|nr:apolipoprotein N-acyltransferase [Chromatiales bacterium]
MSLRLPPIALDLLALLAGAVLVPAFAPFEWRVLAVLAPALFFLTLFNAAPGRAARRGWLFGLGMFGAGVHWVYFSLHLFGAAIAPLAALLTLGFVLAMALLPAAFGWLFARLSRHLPPAIALMALAPALWTLFEWWRGWMLTGFPWLLLGHAQVDTWLGGLAPIGGVYAASWAAALSAGLLAWLSLPRPAQARASAVAALVALWLSAGLLDRIAWTEVSGEPLDVALIQGNVAQEVKWEPESLLGAMRLYDALTLGAHGADIILWPETAIPAFYDEVAEGFLTPIAAEARAAGSHLLTGIFAYDPDSGAMYNSIASLHEAPEFYHKRHLVPFGEYLPLRFVLRWLDRYLEIPMADLSRGSERPLLTAAGHVIGASVCYEDAFGEEVIDALPEAALLVNVSNDAWFGDSIAAHQHLEIARMRSKETGRWLLRATNTGISAVIDHRGAIVARSPHLEQHVLTATVEPRAGMVPYAYFGNWPVVGLALLTVLLALRWRA